VAGVEIGYLVHVLAAALGVSAIVAASPEAFIAVKVAGAGYLIWLGIRAWMSKDETVISMVGASAVGPSRRRGALSEGLLVGALNPKTAIFFLAFLPQFMDTSNGAAWLQITLLGLIFIVMATIPDLAWALAGSAVQRLLPRVRMKTMERISGTVFFGLAAYALTASPAG
jgi:threonine/homoserine/homoserine lactone efflux protein